MRLRELLKEFELPKQRWELVISSADKHELGHDLVSLVQHAYNNTPEGSFVNSIKDVIPSDWNVIDFDEDPGVDATVFYRKPRHNEQWQGHKIQGIGHDGTRPAKDYALSKVHALLLTPGYWIESSDAMRATLKKLHAPAITDEEFLQQLFNDPHLRMVSTDQYQRKLHNKVIVETVFGSPHLSKHTRSAAR